MYKFDDRFLDSVGLADLPADQKESFLQYAQDQFEVRIGEKMAEGLSDAQLDEFEKIIDNDQDTVNKWLGEAGDYRNDDVFKKLVEANGGEDAETVNDYVTARWLNQNCPQYQQIIKDTLDGLRNEISANKEQIINA
jgi:hypothetical protein